MTEGRQPFTAEIKTLAKGPSTYDPLEPYAFRRTAYPAILLAAREPLDSKRCTHLIAEDSLIPQPLEMQRSPCKNTVVRGRQRHVDSLHLPVQAQGLGLRDRPPPLTQVSVVQKTYGLSNELQGKRSDIVSRNDTSLYSLKLRSCCVELLERPKTFSYAAYAGLEAAKWHFSDTEQ